MANPALKNGYISIATELVEKLALVNIPGNEMRIVWVVWRKTWGWKEGNRKKDWDWVSYTQFSKLTDIKRRNCIDCIKSLVSKRILLKKENSYKFNQNYNEWVVSKRTPSVQKHTGVVSKRIQKVVSKSRPTIDNKDTITIERETPSQKASSFFLKEKRYEEIYNKLLTEGAIAKEVLDRELPKFIRYWTEPNKLGTKQRWQLQETFDVGRRLITWFNNIRSFDKKT